jgi:hypothetical protein
MEDSMEKHNNWKRLWAGLTVSTILMLSGTAFGQAPAPGQGQGKPADCANTAGAPAKLEGQVVKVDPGQGQVTLRDPNGATHEFRASPETLQSYKVGDRIEAKLRPQDCKKPAS